MTEHATDTPTRRQQAWLDAAARADGVAASLFRLIAQPNERERGHNCHEHAVGLRRDGRRGFKCGIDGRVVRWLDD
jgi:hypothetical protein